MRQARRGKSRRPEASQAPSPSTAFSSASPRPRTSAEAAGISGLIERRWARSGSDTADLLLSRGVGGRRKEGLSDLAVELLDRVVTLQPNWARAWYTRATSSISSKIRLRRMADLSRALKLEPRHYAAWAGLGQIFMAADDKARALEAFRRALKINPQIPSMQTHRREARDTSRRPGSLTACKSNLRRIHS